MGEEGGFAENIVSMWRDDKPRIIAALTIVLALLAGGAFLLFFSTPPEGELTVVVTNPESGAISGATVRLSGLEGTFSEKADKEGTAVFAKVPTGKSFTVEASGRGFKSGNHEYTLGSAKGEVSIVLEPELENRSYSRTITFTGPSGVRLEGKVLSVELSCSSGAAVKDAARQVSGGVLDIDVPSGCGSLSARVVASGYEADTYTLDSTQVVKLQELIVETGRAVVSVKDSAGRLLDNIEISIRDAKGVSTGDVLRTNFGEAEFVLEPENYTARAVDPTSAFDSKDVGFTVEARGQSKVGIVLSEKAIGTINAKVVDKASKAEVKNAKIVLEKPDGQKEARDFAGEKVSFPVSRQGVYKIRASATGYAAGNAVEINTSQIAQVYTLELAKCTPSTCGVLKVKVVDEDNAPVSNARAALMSGGFFAEEYGLKYTNVKGETVFTGLKAGKYSVTVQKFPAEGDSEEFEAKEGVDSKQEVKLTIGEGKIEVEALDADRKPLHSGFAEFRTEGAEKIGKLPLNAQGKVTFTTKADKRVFVVIQADGYASYTSKAVQVYPNQSTKVSATLQKQVLGESPKIEFVGLYSESGSEVRSVSAGGIYNARFRVTAPVSVAQDSEQLGAFIRAGNEKSAEKEDFTIGYVNAPKASVLKGTTYTGPRGYSEDEKNVTNSEAKWVTVSWPKGEIRQGVYEFDAELKVRDSAARGAGLTLFYRAFAVKTNGKVSRDPLDSELGDAAETTSRQGLYAKSYEKAIFEGAEEQCDEQFCYSERILDRREGLLLQKPYYLRVFGDYEMEFTITNNSKAVHESAQLRVKNSLNGAQVEDKLKIRSYALKNADALDFTSQKDTFEIEPIALGSFRQNKSVGGKLSLRPETIGQTALNFQVISDKQQALNRLVPFSVVNEKDLNISASPETMPAFTEFDMNVEVRFFRGEEDFDEVSGALVRVERTTPERKKSVFVATTDGRGNASLKIPSSEPGTRIKVRVEKEGFAGKTISREVSKTIVSFRPASLRSSLDLTNNNEEKITLEAKNLVPIQLRLGKIAFRGNFLGLLDITKMNNWAKQYEKKTELAFDTPVSFTLISGITDDAKLLNELRRLKGSLVLEFADMEGKVHWPLEVPFEALISLAEPPKEENCIEVSFKEWKDATLGGKAEAEFSVRNNCISQKNNPLDLRNLKAKVEWQGNRHGNLELHLTDTQTGTEASEVLTEGLYSNLFEYVPGAREYTALLVFTPKGGTVGQKAKFDVSIDAAQLTNEGEQLVGATNKVAAEIDIIDLSECIKYTPDPEAGLVIQEGEEEGRLDIDSSACGSVDIDFSLCRANKDCSGGTEGGILVNPKEFTLTPRTPKKSISVARQEIPGLYGMNVDVRTPGSNYRNIKLFNVLAKPTPKDAFALRKYEFSLIGKGSKDSTELTNRFFVENITVDASVCDWGEATEKKWWDWTGAGVGAVLGALSGMKVAMLASHAGAKGLSTGILGKLFGAKAAQKAADAATESSVATLDTVCSKIQTAQSSALNAQTSCAPPNPASAMTSSALAEIEAANGECSAAQAEAKKFRELNASTIKALEGGIGADGGVGSLATGEQFIAQKQALDQAILAKLQAAAAKLQAAAAQYAAAEPEANGYCATNSLMCENCIVALSTAMPQQQEAASTLQSYISKEYGESAAKTGAAAAATAGTKAAALGAKTALQPATSAATSATGAFSTATIMSSFTLGGFFIGGVLPGLFGQDPCAQRHIGDLPDYMINMLSDSHGIESGVKGFLAEYDRASAKIIGNYKEQRIGIVFTNGGVEDQKPVYSTFNFAAKQHLHASPMKISTGNSNFGPFNLPDNEALNVEPKIHLKFRTQEPEESLPDLNFDTLSCVSGNKIGRTGKGAIPKVKLAWNFGPDGIGKDTCLEQNPNGIYCDATQFSIMLSKRLNALREFFDANPSLKCPENPLWGELSAMAKDLNVSTSEGSCYISDWTGYIEGRPAIEKLIEANRNTITWTREISGMDAFMDTVHFNALLIRDGYSDDFRKDFARHYSEQRFFDTPDWFYGLAKDSKGKPYGIGRLFETGSISFRNRFFDSERLSGAGIHEVLISVSGKDGKFNFFGKDGSPNVSVGVEFYLLQEPNPNSAFYAVPFNGLVGLDGDSFNRQGYGVSFENARSDELVAINKDSQPLKSFNDNGSNAVSMVKSAVERSFYGLNTSPSQRGDLFSIEKISSGEVKMRFSPSRATPMMLKVNAGEVSKERLSAFYAVTSSDTPVEAGSVLTFWDGAGACLDPSGVVITESFDGKPDRAATQKDPVLDWERVYAVDFGQVNYTGDAYLRTIFYTNPIESMSIAAEHPSGKMEFLTPDERGSKVPLNGVGGVEFNSPVGGSLGSVTGVSDVFGLVESERVCVVDTGRKASFFWNPKAVYGLKGKQRNISEATNSLAAGKTCIGFG